MQDLPVGTLTLLFSDIEGSTVTMGRLGERWGEALSAQRTILREVFNRHDGREMGTEGDSFFVVFTSARKAVLAAVEGQRRLQRHDWPAGVPIRVRMGLHTGEPVRHEDGYIGLDIHRAARIAGAANGDQVVLSDAARLLAGRLGDDVGFRDLGWHRFKDLAEPEHVHDLVIAGLRSEFPALRSIGTAASLPTASTPLVGRVGELSELRSTILQQQARLLTLTGAGGSGKTRLAIEVASSLGQHFSAGVFFADLHTADGAAAMWLGIADALDALGDADELPKDRVLRFLGDRSALLILDNLEQVPDADRVVSELLNDAPQLRVVATSRRPLHLVSEYEHPVPPLELPTGPTTSPSEAARAGAVDLFVRRARMVRPAFELTEQNVGDVVELCARLDGLPLAIELAAARSKILSPHALLGRLEQAPGGGISAVDRTERQLTIAATIRWSYELLSDAEQMVFSKLGVFAGQCDLEAIQEVVGAPDVDPLDTVAHLVDMSLVQIVDSPDGEPRISMLQTIKDFARHELEATPQADEIRLRHAQWCVRKAHEVDQLLSGPTQIDALDLMSLVEDDVRAALAWCLVPTGDVHRERTTCGLHLVKELTMYWYRFGYAAEGRAWFDRALAVADAVDSLEMVNALHGMAILRLQEGDTQAAVDGLQRGLDMTRRLGERDLEARELNSLAVAHRHEGRLVEARRLVDRSIQIAREIGSARREGTALANLVVFLIDSADWPAAVAAGHAAVAASERLGDAWAISSDESNLTMALLHAEGAETAHAHLAAVAPRGVALGDPELNLSIVETFAVVFAHLGEVKLAARLVGACDRHRAAIGIPRSQPDQALLDQSIDSTGTRSDPRWPAAYEAGAALSMDEATSEALSARVVGARGA